jgi:hypothetical protein
MPRWRYQTIVAKPVVDYSHCYVFSIDGDAEAPIIERRGLFAERIRLHDYLAGAGEEGWEVCGVSPMPTSTLLILKKPMTDE